MNILNKQKDSTKAINLHPIEWIEILRKTVSIQSIKEIKDSFCEFKLSVFIFFCSKQ